MKHAISVMLLAGMAGGAVWYRTDQSPSRPVTKLRIPDPGLEDDALAESPLPEPLDIQLMAPVDELPKNYVAQRKAEILNISDSDEQPFAVSHPDAEDSAKVKKTSAPRSDVFEPVEADDAEPEAVEESRKKPERANVSIEGRPISIRRLGQGNYRTVIITGLDGRDLTAVEWTDELVAALEQRHDLLQQQEFVIIRAANPDGLASRTRENARGVDLNRNFPTRRYVPSDKSKTGRGPASEPETRVLLETLYEFRPQRVVHLCSTSGKSGVYVNQQASDVADRLKRHYSLPIERLNYDQLPASMEEFSEATWQSGVIRVHLHGVPEDEVVRRIVPVVITSVAAKDIPPGRQGTVAPVSTPRQEQSRWQSGPASSPVPTRSNQPSDRRSRPVQRRGYEELPPPPQD